MRFNNKLFYFLKPKNHIETALPTESIVAPINLPSDLPERSWSVYISWPDKLLDMSADLKNISQKTEREFLAVGMKLQVFSQGCHENSSCASSILNMIHGEKGFQESKFKELLENIHSEIKLSASCITSGITDVRELRSNIEDILALVNFFKKLARSITILGSLIRIETARVKEEEFYVMADFVDALADKAKEEAEQIGCLVNLAKISLTASMENMSASVSEVDQELAIIKGRVTEILKEMEKMISQAESACKRIEGRVSQIEPEVGEVVMALQFHDICRQQMEHVAEAFDKIAKKITDLSSEDKVEISGFGQWISQTITIQISQLRHVITEVVSSADKISRHLTRITELAEAQSEDAWMILAEEESGSHVISKKCSELESLSHLLDESKMLILNTLDVISRVNDSIIGMSNQVSRIEAISENIDLLALNAIIKVSHTGETGKGLEVIAEEIRKLSDNSREEISTGSENIRSILEMSDTLRDRLTGELNKQLFLNDEILARIKASITGLLKTGELMMKGMGEISRTTNLLNTDRVDLVASLTFSEVIKSRLDEVISQLMSMMTENSNIIHFSEETGSEVLNKALQELTDRYTMDSEQKIHDHALSTGKNNGKGPFTMARGIRQESIGDNVELF